MTEDTPPQKKRKRTVPAAQVTEPRIAETGRNDEVVVVVPNKSRFIPWEDIALCRAVDEALAGYWRYTRQPHSAFFGRGP